MKRPKEMLPLLVLAHCADLPDPLAGREFYQTGVPVSGIKQVLSTTSTCRECVSFVAFQGIATVHKINPRVCVMFILPNYTLVGRFVQILEMEIVLPAHDSKTFAATGRQTSGTVAVCKKIIS